MAKQKYLYLILLLPLLIGLIAIGVSDTSASSPISITRLTSDVPLSTLTPIMVQNTFAIFTSGSSGNKAFNSNLGSANTIVVCEGEATVTQVATTPSDTLGLPYSIIAQTNALNAASMVCWKAMTGNGGADTVTFNFISTCSATIVCLGTLNEISGTDIAAIASTTGSNTVATTTPTMTTKAFTKTPLLLGFYMKQTTGTDTAGTSFNLMNSESGSLLYLTEYSTTLTSTLSNFPATFGTASAFAGVGVILFEETQISSISLSANTNYLIHLQYYVTGTGTTFTLWAHQITQSGVTFRYICVVNVANNCFATTDGGIVPAVTLNTDFYIDIEIEVGANPITLTVNFTDTASNTSLQTTVKTGSIIEVITISN